MSAKKFRYPGINYFTEADEDIFKGRKDDVDRLYTEIYLSDTTVLHAKSGEGKSSLIRAGLIPYLKRSHPNLVPIIINFGRFKNQKSSILEEKDFSKKDFLVNVVLESVELEFDAFLRNQEGSIKETLEKDLPYLDSKANNLWYILKKLGRVGCSFLLIFDQFEEFESYSEEQQKQLARGLREVFEERIPPKFMDEVESRTESVFSGETTQDERRIYEENIGFLEKKIKAKALFVIREDRLGVMCFLTDYIPNILKNEYRLKALTREQASKAISLPAQLEEGHFKSPKFKFDDEALNVLLDRLQQDTEFIDPLQLQIVTSGIEQKVKTPNELITVRKVPHLKRVISSFYRNKWKKVKTRSGMDEADFDDIREKVLNDLIVNDVNRNLVHEESLKQIANGKGLEIANLLKDEGVLKIERKYDAQFYCLAHDSMVKPANYDLRRTKDVNKKLKKAKNRLWLVEGISAIVVAALIIFGVVSRNYTLKAKKDELIYQKKINDIRAIDLADSIKMATIKKENEVKNREIDSIISLVQNSELSENYKTQSINSLTTLKRPMTSVMYYSRTADGDLVTNALKTLDSTRYEVILKHSLSDTQDRNRVNTMYYGKNVSSIERSDITDALKDNGIHIVKTKKFNQDDSFDFKQNIVQILYETHDKEYSVRMYSFNSNKGVKDRMTNFLGENYQLKVYPDWKERPSFFSNSSTVLYYSDQTKLEAEHLANQLNSLLSPFNIKFRIYKGHGLGVAENEKNKLFIIHYLGK